MHFSLKLPNVFLIGTSIALVKRSEGFLPSIDHDFPHLLGAERVSAWLDDSIDPCKDFYKFSCGGFKKRYQHYKRADVLELMQQANSILIQQIMTQPPEKVSNSPEDNEVYHKSKRYFDSCLNVAEINHRGFAPVANLASQIIKKFNSNSFSLTKTIGFLQNNAVWSILRTTYTKIEGHSPKDLRFQVYPAASYDVTKNDVKNILKPFFENGVVDLPKDLNLDSISGWIADVEASFSGSISLGNAQNKADENSKFTTIEKFSKDTGLKWQEYFDELGLKGDNKLYIYGSAKVFIKQIKELQNFKKQDLLFYFLYRLGVSHYNKLSKKYFELTNSLNAVRSSCDDPTDKMETFQQNCIEEYGVHLNYMAGHVYTKYAFDAKQKAIATKMINDLWDAFGSQLDSLKWMDTKTKAAAREKLSKMTRIVGYPDWVSDADKILKFYGDMDFDKDKYFENAVKAQASAEFSQSKKQIGKDWLREEIYFGYPWQLNAFHLTDYVQVQINTGILQRPLFTSKNRDSMNYGSLGMIIGHEITHAFDSIGKKLNSEGENKPWWSERSEGLFKDGTQCFEKQYGKYQVKLMDESKPVLAVDGSLTLSENIADNGGLKVAFAAWKSHMEGLGEDDSSDSPMEEFGGLTDDQLFFVSFAQTWCTVDDDLQVEYLIKKDPHAPNAIRVSGAVANSEAFAEAFQCKRGPMNLKHKCMLY